MSCGHWDFVDKEEKEGSSGRGKKDYVFTDSYFIFLLGMWEGHLCPVCPDNWILARTCGLQVTHAPSRPSPENHLPNLRALSLWAGQIRDIHGVSEAPGDGGAVQWKEPGFLLEQSLYLSSSNHTGLWDGQEVKLCESLSFWSCL